MFPHERSLVQKMQGRPFVLLGVNNDKEISRVKQSVKKNKINWRSFYDGAGGPIVRMFGIRSFPTIMLIDHRGVIHTSSIRENLDEEIEKLVKNAEAAGMVGEKIAATSRVFRDKTGKHKIEAIAESSDGQSVVLRKQDNSTVTVEIANLSKADQRYLQLVDLQSGSADHSTVAVDDESFRIFRDTSGKFEVNAKLVKIEGDRITLEKQDGSEIEVPIAKLGQDEQEYVRRKRGL